MCWWCWWIQREGDLWIITAKHDVATLHYVQFSGDIMVSFASESFNPTCSSFTLTPCTSSLFQEAKSSYSSGLSSNIIFSENTLVPRSRLGPLSFSSNTIIANASVTVIVILLVWNPYQTVCSMMARWAFFSEAIAIGSVLSKYLLNGHASSSFGDLLKCRFWSLYPCGAWKSAFLISFRWCFAAGPWNTL